MTTTIPTTPDYLSVPQFAERMGVTPRTVWRWVKGGKVTHWRRGATTRIAATELTATHA